MRVSSLFLKDDTNIIGNLTSDFKCFCINDNTGEIPVPPTRANIGFFIFIGIEKLPNGPLIVIISQTPICFLIWALAFELL